MVTTEIIELTMKPVGPFWSQLDEDPFFEWLGKISSVAKYEGEGHILYIYVKRKQVNQQQLRELLAILYRYDIDMKQLAIFDRPRFKNWFHEKESYWVDQVFA